MKTNSKRKKKKKTRKKYLKLRKFSIQNTYSMLRYILLLQFVLPFYVCYEPNILRTTNQKDEEKKNEKMKQNFITKNIQ